MKLCSIVGRKLQTAPARYYHCSYAQEKKLWLLDNYVVPTPFLNFFELFDYQV